MTGINVKVRYGDGSLIIRIKKFVHDGAVAEIDETDSESGGYGDCDESGFAQADVSFEGWVRSADGAPIIEGTLLTNVLVCLDGNVGAPVLNKRFLYPKLKVLKANTTGETKGGSVSYALTCKTSSTYKPPGIS